jgi:sugar lactone lactonase YvrE
MVEAIMRSIRLRMMCLVVTAGALSCGRADRTAAVPEWRLVKDLAIGGADSGAASFNDIRGIAVVPDGHIFVLDFQAQELRLFDSTGKFVKLVARRGQGPGELGNANGLATGPGNRVWVNDPQNGRFSVYGSNGAFVGQHVVPISSYGYLWMGGVDSTGRLYDDAVYIPNDTAKGRPIRRFSADFARLDTLRLPSCRLDTKPAMYTFTARVKGRQITHGVMEPPYAPEIVSVLDLTGRFWCARSDRDEVTQFGLASRDTLRVIHGTRTAVAISAAQRDSAERSVKEFAKKMGDLSPDLSLIGHDQPIIRQLTVDDEGRLWVLTGAADTGAVYDLYAPDGRVLAHVRADFAGAPWSAWHPVIRGDRFYTTVTDADGVPTVVRAHIERTP